MLKGMILLKLILTQFTHIVPNLDDLHGTQKKMLVALFHAFTINEHWSFPVSEEEDITFSNAPQNNYKRNHSSYVDIQLDKSQ